MSHRLGFALWISDALGGAGKSGAASCPFVLSPWVIQMRSLSFKSSEAEFLRKVLLRFAADADRRAVGSLIDAAALLHAGARDNALALVDKLQAAQAVAAAATGS